MYMPSAMQAQKDRFDKKNADEFVYEQLSKNTGGEDFCKKLILNKQNLADTNEERIKLLPGKSFQINSLRSDVFIDAKTWKPVFDHSYPMESAVNLLMNLAGNCNVTLTQHQYGNGGMFAYNSAFMLPPFLNSSLVGMLTTKRCMMFCLGLCITRSAFIRSLSICVTLQ